MISSKDNPDFAIFSWKDPQEDENGWKTLRESHIGLASCKSCGWIIDETKDYYVVASDLVIEKNRITDTGRRHSIYKSWLSRCERIEYNIYEKQMETVKENTQGSKNR